MCLHKNKDISEDSFYDVNIKFKDGKTISEKIRDIKELKALLENIEQELAEVRLQDTFIKISSSLTPTEDCAGVETGTGVEK